MPDLTARVNSEATLIPGPVGELEALIDIPANSDASRVVVLCHPHPQHGGTMTNKVVHMLAKSFNELGMPAVRFNFRGVGRSLGTYAEGTGETQDTLAVIDWAATRWPQAAVALGGFSFGGAIAIRAATERTVHRLVTVAPAVDRVSVSSEHLPQCPWLIVQGDQDELVDAQSTQHWIESLATPPELVVLPGVDHFFHGRLNELRSTVVEWLRKQGM